jgi:hypothetical protein
VSPPTETKRAEKGMVMNAISVKGNNGCGGWGHPPLGDGGTKFISIGWCPHRPKRNVFLSVGVSTDRNEKDRKGDGHECHLG